MPHAVALTKKAEKDVARLDKSVRDDVRNAITALASEPRPSGCKPLKGDLAGTWRLVVRESYRLLYEIDDEAEQVRVKRVKARGGAYK